MKTTTTKFKNLKAVKEIQKIIGQVKAAQAQLRKLVRDKKAIAQAKQYTEQFRSELKKRLGDDIARMRVFLDRAREEVKALQTQYLRRPRRPKKARTKKGAANATNTD